MPSSRSLVILGAGYAGRFILPIASRHYDVVVSTSRDPDARLADVPADRRLRFDLNEPDTWRNLPPEADLLWCFPAAPPDLVHRFAASWQGTPRRLVVLGSTSAYDLPDCLHDYPPAWTDETAPIDLARPRVQGEEWLRQHHGAIVLRVAGMYGPGRNPLDWIKSGRVTASRKYVNLIHAADLAAMCLIALERGTPGTVYNVSDGHPRTWNEICLMAEREWHIRSAPSPDGSAVGKRVSNAKLLGLLTAGGQSLHYPDLVRSLHEIQEPCTTPSAGP